MLDIIKSIKTSSISNERLVLCLVYHHSIPKTNPKFLVLLKSSSRTTKLWSFSVDVGSASPKESHFGRSFHTSSVMCFQTEACTCNRSLASVLLASQKTPTIDSCTEPTYQLASPHYSASWEDRQWALERSDFWPTCRLLRLWRFALL